MIKFYEISQIDKLAVGDGTIKAASGGTKNGFLGTVVNGVVAPSSNGVGLKLFENYGAGDDYYSEFIVPSGEFMTAWDMTVQKGKNIQATPESITYASGENYASITEGVTLMAAGSDGNLAIIANASGIGSGGVYFTVKKKIEFGGNGVLAEVTVK